MKIILMKKTYSYGKVSFWSIYKKTGKIFFLILFPIYKKFDSIFQKNKENLWKKARERHQNLSEEEKDKKL